MDDPKPNLGFYRKSAKDLKRAAARGDAAAVARLGGRGSKSGDFTLADAQLAIAREHGLSSWAELRQAVERGALDPSAAPSDRLFAALRRGDANGVRALLSGAPGLAGLPNAKGVLPLVEASDRGACAIAELLLDAGAPADPRALLAAAHPGPHKSGPALDVIELLLRRGVPYDVFAQATLGRIQDLKRSLPGVDLEARGPDHSTALFLAAWNGQVEAVRLLLDAGADPNPVCRDGVSAWQVVFSHAPWSEPHRAVARLMLDHGVSCSLQEACVLGHLPAVERMLRQDPSQLDRPDARGGTPLSVALLNAHSQLCALLLAAGASDPQGQGRALIDAKPIEHQNLAGALYRSCSLRLANFNDVNLEYATFSNVNLRGARIANVNLSGARIDDAFIRGLTIYGIEVEPLLHKELARRATQKATPK